jgi:hypothetical protein
MFPGALLDPNSPAWCLVLFFIAIRWASMGKVERIVWAPRGGGGE